jgi:hypothetical protein
MVRVRQQTGETVTIDKMEAVEILGLDGRLAAVVIQDRKGTIHVAYPGDPLFAGYCRVYGMQPAQLHKHFESVR